MTPRTAMAPAATNTKSAQSGAVAASPRTIMPMLTPTRRGEVQAEELENDRESEHECAREP